MDISPRGAVGKSAFKANRRDSLFRFVEAQIGEDGKVEYKTCFSDDIAKNRAVVEAAGDFLNPDTNWKKLGIAQKRLRYCTFMERETIKIAKEKAIEMNYALN